MTSKERAQGDWLHYVRSQNIELNSTFRRFHNVLVYYDFQRGMMQHYQIGQLLRKRYMTDQIFLNETYDRDEVCKEPEKCY